MISWTISTFFLRKIKYKISVKSENFYHHMYYIPTFIYEYVYNDCTFRYLFLYQTIREKHNELLLRNSGRDSQYKQLYNSIDIE